MDVGGFDVGYVEVRRGRRWPKIVENTVDSIETKNAFQALVTENEEDEIGFVGIETSDEHIAIVGTDKKALKTAGRGKITIDSGAAESVLLVDVVPNETFWARRR